MITASILLAEAAVRFESLNAVQSQSYGAAARGGAARSDVIIWDQPIYFPRVIQPNILVCLTQQAFDAYQSTIRPGGYLVTDADLVKSPTFVDARRVELPFEKTVTERIGKVVVLNICLLGAVVELTGLVRLESVKKLIRERFSPAFHDMNLNALDLGAELLNSRSG